MKLTLKDRYLGEIKANKFLTYRRPEHFFRKHKSFGFAEKIFPILVENGATHIIITYDGITEKVKYGISVRKAMLNAIWVHEPPFEPQIHIPIKELTVLERKKKEK